MNLRIISIDTMLNRQRLIEVESENKKLHMSEAVYCELMRGEYSLLGSESCLKVVDRHGVEMDTVNNCHRVG